MTEREAQIVHELIAAFERISDTLSSRRSSGDIPTTVSLADIDAALEETDAGLDFLRDATVRPEIKLAYADGFTTTTKAFLARIRAEA